MLAWRDPLDPPAAPGRVVGDEEALYADRARRLGLRFAPVVLLGRGATAANAAAVRKARFALSTVGERLFFLAPRGGSTSPIA